MVKRIGTRREVFEGRAERTSGNLRRKDLAMAKSGKVVSAKKQKNAKSGKNNLSKYLKTKDKNG